MGFFSDLFGGGEPQQELTFDAIPAGKYLVRFSSEAASYIEFVLVTFEVVAGDHNGAKIPLVIRTAIAKRVTREATGDYISRMSFEGDSKASKLEYAMSYAVSDTDGIFIVNYKDGTVTSIPEHDAESIGRLLKRLKEK